MTRRPVAFRVKIGEAWLLCPTEDEARQQAETHGVDYQGLYIRDNPRADAEPQSEPDGARQVPVGRTVGLIPATGANPWVRFSTAWEREDYERQQRGEKPIGPPFP